MEDMVRGVKMLKVFICLVLCIINMVRMKIIGASTNQLLHIWLKNGP